MSESIKLEDLWVGDKLLLKKSKRTGFFHGVKDGKVRVKIDGSFVLTSLSNVALAPKKRSNSALEEIKETFRTSSTKSNYLVERQKFNPTIDLHMEALQPSKRNDSPFAIIEFQIRKLTEFMEDAIKLRFDKVTIIHGKGTGALKMETEHVVQSFDEYVSTYPINNGGGMIVYLKYS